MSGARCTSRAIVLARPGLRPSAFAISVIEVTYATKDEAKLALFDDFWVATQDDEQLWASD